MLLSHEKEMEMNNKVRMIVVLMAYAFTTMTLAHTGEDSPVATVEKGQFVSYDITFSTMDDNDLDIAGQGVITYAATGGKEKPTVIAASLQLFVNDIPDPMERTEEYLIPQNVSNEDTLPWLFSLFAIHDKRDRIAELRMENRAAEKIQIPEPGNKTVECSVTVFTANVESNGDEREEKLTVYRHADIPLFNTAKFVFESTEGRMEAVFKTSGLLPSTNGQ